MYMPPHAEQPCSFACYYTRARAISKVKPKIQLSALSSCVLYNMYNMVCHTYTFRDKLKFSCMHISQIPGMDCYKLRWREEAKTREGNGTPRLISTSAFCRQNFGGTGCENSRNAYKLLVHGSWTREHAL